MKLFSYLLSLFALLLNPVRHSKYISCAPAAINFRATISSVQSGAWSDPATWGGHIPAVGDAPAISNGHVVFVDTSVSIAGMQVAGTLSFDATKSEMITSTHNIIITGLLEMLSPKPSVIQTIRFTGINESKFIGGGEEVMASDIGLWVMGSGQLNLKGADKTSWGNAMDNVNTGSSLVLITTNGWLPGDDIAITPTASGATVFDNSKIVSVASSIAGEVLAVNPAITTAHPIVNGKWTAEVMNLTRNVCIEGTATGKSHVFIRSSKPQFIRNVQFRYLGPRKQQAGDAATEFVLGRYGIHFHHCMEGSRGSVVERCVMRDVDNHSYVTHGSNGVTLRDNIAYNVTETPYWWDEGFEHASHDIAWVHNIAALVKYVPRSINVSNSDGDPTMSSRGFLLGHGDGNICDSNVAVGTMGDPRDGGGFKWEAVSNDHPEGVWQFIGNLAHNCNTGSDVWQNVQSFHTIRRFVAYNNEYGIFHGAYVNDYMYKECELYNNPMILHAASSNTGRLRVEDCTIDAGGKDYAVIIEGNSEVGAVPILIRNLKTSNYRLASVVDQSGQTKHCADIIQSAGVFKVSSLAISGEVLRVQPITGQPYKVTKSGKSNITPFAPSIWGTGTGLKGEYFNNPDFTAPAFVRTDAYIGFSEWGNGVNHLIKYSTYSVRWTGKIQPQFSETYTFKVPNAGTVQLLLNGKMITGPVALTAGQMYDIKLEYSKATSLRGGIELYWTSTSMEKYTKGGELVPQSQLYPG